ncbi:MAG: M3 family metallopeptidase, partial [Gammaproteobacteria bacterium]|nr:M3 family metallopeptidase [Gammaproteobacteria bacterium]
MLNLTRVFAAIALLLLGFSAAAQEEPVAVDPRYTWDLTDLYADVEAWDAARQKVLADLERIEQRRGTLGESADSLYQALAAISDATRESFRVAVYSGLAKDEDLRVSETQERDQLSDLMFTRFSEATAWLQPEILEVGAEVIHAYLNEDNRLEPFRFQLEDALRNSPHTLGNEAEQTLAYMSRATSIASDVYGIAANSDIPWPEIELSTGEKVRIDSQGYGRWRASENRDDRKLVFDTFWGKWLEYRNSVGAMLNGHVQTQVALARARNYDGVLHRELFQDNLPPEVYHTLVDEVNEALPTLYR